MSSALRVVEFDREYAPGAPSLRAAVVICAYTMHRFEDLAATLESVDRQTRPADDVVVVIDHDPGLLARAQVAFPHLTVIANGVDRGLSGARNVGVGATDADVVAFLDDDAVAHPAWLEEGLRPLLEDPDVVGVGCRIDPVWDDGRPAWFPSEFLWVVGCDYLGLPERGEIRNPIGAAMLVRREAILSVGGFGVGVGRTAHTLDGCEETELAILIRREDRSARFVREPEAIVFHRVTRNRHSVWYFLRRCFAEGRSKRRLVRRIGAESGLSAERGHVVRLLLLGVPRELMGIVRGRFGGAARAGALLIGLGVTALGYVAGSAGEA